MPTFVLIGRRWLSWTHLALTITNRKLECAHWENTLDVHCHKEGWHFSFSFWIIMWKTTTYISTRITLMKQRWKGGRCETSLKKFKKRTVSLRLHMVVTKTIPWHWHRLFKTWSEAVPVLQKIGIQVQVEETTGANGHRTAGTAAGKKDCQLNTCTSSWMWWHLNDWQGYKSVWRIQKLTCRHEDLIFRWLNVRLNVRLITGFSQDGQVWQ